MSEIKDKPKWKKIEGRDGAILDNGEGKVYISYQPNKHANPDPNIDSTNPETTIVIYKDKKIDPATFPVDSSIRKNFPDGLLPRYLIYRGDWTNELEKLYPDIDALKAHWKEHGGHFWSDNLD